MGRCIDEAAEFVRKYSTYTDARGIASRIAQHLAYKTCRIVLDKAGMVCAVCLWNISPDGETVDVIDLIIREDHRRKGFMRKILADGLKIWPVKYIRFEKGYDDGAQTKPKHLLPVDRFLRRNA